MKKSVLKKIMIVILALMAVAVCYPIFFLIEGSLMEEQELSRNLSAVLGTQGGFVKWELLPTEPTLRHYVELLLDTPRFFVMFWNSVCVVGFTLLGQAVFGAPAAWAFAKYKFRFRGALFMLYVALMMLPFQVVMLSEYLVLDALHLLNTLESLIFPGIFSTFPVFIMYHFFRGIPDSIMESAQLDGANDFWVFVKIGIPLGSSGIISAMVLGFLEYWNLIEQPLTFIKDKSLWPMSLFLPNIGMEQAGLAFVASVIALVPSVLVFFAGQDYLEQGIAATAVKE